MLREVSTKSIKLVIENDIRKKEYLGFFNLVKKTIIIDVGARRLQVGRLQFSTKVVTSNPSWQKAHCAGGK